MPQENETQQCRQYTLARLGYEAYRDALGLSFPLGWEGLPAGMRLAWFAATAMIAGVLLKGHEGARSVAREVDDAVDGR